MILSRVVDWCQKKEIKDFYKKVSLSKWGRVASRTRKKIRERWFYEMKSQQKFKDDKFKSLRNKSKQKLDFLENISF